MTTEMRSDETPADVVATCHCGAIEMRLAAPPAEVRHCNCSLCRRYGVLWAYFPIVDVAFGPGASRTDTYAWNGRTVDFHRCRTCGCLTHWLPRGSGRNRMGVNARLLDPEILAAAEVRYKDSAGTGRFQ
jgi:hypothetical protein